MYFSDRLSQAKKLGRVFTEPFYVVIVGQTLEMTQRLLHKRLGKRFGSEPFSVFVARSSFIFTLTLGYAV